MAQPLPKIDSREFEVPKEEPKFEAATVLCLQPNVSSFAVEMYVRLWTNAAGESKPVDASWQTQNALLHMISDLIVASDAKLGTDPKKTIAEFPSVVSALTVARRIQRSVQAFAKLKPDSPRVGIALAGCDRTTTASTKTGAGPRALAKLVDYAQSGKIVLADDVCEQLKDLPGLQLQKVSSGARQGESDSGIQELVWASDETTARFKHLFDRFGVPVSADGTLSLGNLQAGSSAGSSELVSDDSGDVSKPFSRTLILSIAGVALALVVIFSLLLTLEYRRQSAQRPPRSSPGSEHPAPQPSAVQSIPEPAPAASDSSESLPQAPAEEPKRAAGSLSNKKKHTAPTVAEPPERPTSVDGFFASDVPLLLKKAEQDAGAGDYSDARRTYEIILRLDPGNGAARQGLHRLQLSATESHN